MDIKVSRIRQVDKGALKAYFTVEIDGFYLRDCSYFCMGTRDWMNFPQQIMPAKEGEKIKYIPYCGYVDPSKGTKIKDAIIVELKKELQNESHTQKNQQSEFSSYSSDLPF